jgi:D-alanyl-D-alanine carboxypeptidase
MLTKNLVFYSLFSIFQILFAESVVLYIENHSNNQQILEKKEPQPIASLTKLFTAYFIYKSNYDLKHTVLIIESAKFSKLNPKAPLLQKGDKISLESALEILLLTSSNLVARSIAISLEGSENKFLDKMNSYFKSIHLDNSHFADTHGLSINSKSNANDILSILNLYTKEIFLTNIIRKQKSEILTNSNQKYNLETTLEKTEFKDFRLFGKTGSTLAAGRCFAGFLENKNKLNKIVILNAENIYKEIDKVVLDRKN